MNTADGQTWLLRKPVRLLSKGDTAKAMSTINKRIDRHPRTEDLYKLRAETKQHRGDLTEAMVDYNTFCSLSQSRCSEVALNKAHLMYHQKLYQYALEHYNSIPKTQQTPEVLLQNGLCNEKLGRSINALGAFTKALGNDADNFSAAYNAGRIAYKLDKHELAEEYFSKATHLLPGDYDAWLGLGITRYNLQRYEDSNKALRQALAIRNEDARVLYNMGVNYYHLNEHDLCCTYWNRAIQSGSLAAEIETERYCTSE
ncbi:MAG: hypothetical protein Salg2KO_08470 [Salibacteraceae bacterium]